MSQAQRGTISVKVQPRASRDEVLGVRDGTLWVRVKAAPVDGKANAAMVELLGERLGIAKSRIRVVRGHTSRDKRVSVEGMSSEDVMLRLDIGPLEDSPPS